MIEPSAGVDRATARVPRRRLRRGRRPRARRASCCASTRALAPVKAAVFPLLRKDGQPEKAQAIRDLLKPHFAVAYDQAGAIGRRYRRQDEIGTPFCITVDHETMQDDTVTVRDATRWSRSACPSIAWSTSCARA